MSWLRLAAALAFSYVVSLFQKPPPGPRAPRLSDLEFPNARQGESVGFGDGTFRQRKPKAAWWGHFRKEKITDKVGKK